jgi:hypothetical protein
MCLICIEIGRPFGTQKDVCEVLAACPGAEAPGYYQSPLWGSGCHLDQANSALRIKSNNPFTNRLPVRSSKPSPLAGEGRVRGKNDCNNGAWRIFRSADALFWCRWAWRPCERSSPR